MGRKEKVLKEKIIDDLSIDKRQIGYYSTPSFICDYITRRVIDVKNNGKSVFDPCCGREEMLNPFNKFNIETYGIDIIKYKEEYNCNFENTDFIKYYYEFINSNNQIKNLNYDYYVLNPPYNCHEVQYIRDNKKELKKYFNDVGVHNMYGIFISAIMDMAKDGAVIGIITHDSFLTSKSYDGLRKKILNTCSIHEITMCPTDLFLEQGAEVRTSIVILQKGLNYQGNIIINNRCRSREELVSILKSDENHLYKLKDIVLNNIIDNSEFILECPNEIKDLFKLYRLGEQFKCITGISTGNDKLYLSKEKKEPYIVPFYKNPGRDRYYTNKIMYINKDFMNISKSIPNFIVRNKELLYKTGIICSSMGVQFTACKLPKESTFGVNTCIICEDKDIFWLLAYLNSTLVTYLVRGVLNRSNMITSGYVSRIPLLNFDNEVKNKLAHLGSLAYENVKNEKDISDTLKEIDKIVNNTANLSTDTVLYIDRFKFDLVKRT
ncbi:BREX-1 system adenine-specific DNA-methyltransferase PglX [Clostridium sp. DSM 100503]|uniref:BREX-1 system adenine-specific DNA-methyltransferase PglX n=1 Tax=Clostridium sp. DSM 100503 TaxID=2963282 RepID=UPI002149E1AE|nr:BREX-1 system adenine-specific DNA-methyltransferase PglX [Clostridium sp. DSM 100503]MCR1952033.1 BREX-1 system adenine-specific DNA-methyltransferase PglX [Clostridium sp. DSM 100503]